MEPLLGHDFARVRVHTDDHAADATGAIGARAYTIGHDLVFAPGQSAPGSARGRRLLAHELAHAAQQPAAHGVPEHLDRTLRDDPAEREANAAADAVTSGRRLVPRLVHSPTIACQDIGTPDRGPSPYLERQLPPSGRQRRRHCRAADQLHGVCPPGDRAHLVGRVAPFPWRVKLRLLKERGRRRNGRPPTMAEEGND
jgi:Domain of unknown function (DUF4157)